jgi:uncharacterized small protein (DUF1192 family)
VSDNSPESGKHETKRSNAARFLRRIFFGIVALAGLLWFVAHLEHINQERGIESSRATGLSAGAWRSYNAPMLSKGLAAQFRLAQAPAARQGVLIARTASIHISVRDFRGARESVNRVVKAHNGYMTSMTIASPKDTSQSLVADIAIPAAQCDAALGEFKMLGRVEEERQSSEEVTAQTEDLDIRLKNAHEAETRLSNILRMGTGKVGDVLEVEKEMARVREEIERMEAEQKRLNNRVAFASIGLDLTEEFQAQLGRGRSLLGLRTRNALVDGYHDATDGLLGVLVFFLSVGPSLILWALILLLPARWAWRRWRKSRTDGPASA